MESVLTKLSQQPYPDGYAQAEARALRERLGALFGVPGHTIAFVRGTAHGISNLAQGLDWAEGDNVVSARGEYPANVYPWMALEARGVQLRQAPHLDGRVTPEAVLGLVDERTRVVAFSMVEFWNGYRVDIRSIGEECRKRGVIVAVDGIQAFGALDVNLGELPIDYASAGGYKWMMAPNGIGFTYCHPDLLPRIRPVLLGPGSMKNPNEYFKYDLDLADTSQRFEESTVSVMSVAGFGAAVELFHDVGMDVVERRVLSLSRRLAEGLAERGYEVLGPWPRGEAEASGIVSFRKPGSSAGEILRDLNASRVVCRIHADFVRLSPHFYNTEEEVDRVLAFLAPEVARP